MLLTPDLFRQMATVSLHDAHIDELSTFGTVHETRAGEVLYEAGDSEYSLVVVLSGRTATVDRSDGEEMTITTSGHGEFDGEVGLLTGQNALTTCVVREAGEVLLVPRAGVQQAVAISPELGDTLVTAFAARRQLMMLKAAATLTIIGPETSSSAERLQEFTARNRIPCRWLTPMDPTAVAMLNRFGVEPDGHVWVVIRGTKLLKDPTTLQVAGAVGLDLPACTAGSIADMIVIGAGPAGLAAAVYGASEGLSTVVVDKVGIGGQAGNSSRIENYLGFPAGIAGADLAFKAELQAVKFGARVTMPRRATSLSNEGGLIRVALNDGSELHGRSAIIATGARYRDLGVPGQQTFQGVGVYHAATEVESRRCRGGAVAVVGAGNSAGQAAMFLSRTAETVHLVCRGPSLGRSMSQYLVSRIERTANVKVHTECTVCEIQGGDRLETATIINRRGELQQFRVTGLFVMIGAEPGTDWLKGSVQLDDKGFVLTGSHAIGPGESSVSPFQTSLPGVFAVGDVRSGSVKRVASAVGEGSVVVSSIHQHLTDERLLTSMSHLPLEGVTS